MSYGDQQKFGNGRTLYKQSEQITGHGQQQTLFKKDLLLSTVLVSSVKFSFMPTMKIDEFAKKGGFK